MDRKIVREAVPPTLIPSDADRMKRALDLLIAKGGVFRTDESWVYRSLRRLISEGFVSVDNNVLSIGDNFEQLLMNLAENLPVYTETLKNYRKLVLSQIEKYDVINFSVMENLSKIQSTDEKIVYLTSVIAKISGNMEEALKKISYLESFCEELNTSVSVIESIVPDADFDG